MQPPGPAVPKEKEGGSRRRYLRALAALNLALLPLPACTPADPAPEASAVPATQSPAVPSPAPEEVVLSIGYTGDLLMHLPVLESTPGQSGDIAPLVADAAPWIQGADLAFCGMEVPVAPDSQATGYPRFGTLPGVVQGVAQTGWDGCATASNHAVDQGQEGVNATIDQLEAHGLGRAGTNRSEAESRRPYQLYRLQRGGRSITVAQLSTTFGLNGLPDETGWEVQLNDVAAIAAHAQAARAEGASIVVLHSQLGAEYLSEPVAEQVDYAQQIAATGQVDVLFGAHPHVPQRAELLPGGREGRGMWVSYSAGNFLSNQSEETVGEITSAVGTFVWVQVQVSVDGSAQVESLHWHPFTVDHHAGHRLRDLAAMRRGEVPADCQISPEEAERRWEALTASLGTSTYSDTPPRSSGPRPEVLRRGQ